MLLILTQVFGQVAQYAVKCLSRVWLVKYNNIYCVASLLSGLSQFQVSQGE